jgi:hypothetical protein
MRGDPAEAGGAARTQPVPGRWQSLGRGRAAYARQPVLAYCLGAYCRRFVAFPRRVPARGLCGSSTAWK